MKTDLVVAGYVFRGYQLLLVEHRQLGLWLPIGGHIEKDETPDQAVIREVREEVGLNIEILSKDRIPLSGNVKKNLATPFYVNVHPVRDHDHCCFFYVCKDKGGKIVSINSKEIKRYDWFRKEDLNQKRVPVDVRNIGNLAFEIYERF